VLRANITVYAVLQQLALAQCWSGVAEQLRAPAVACHTRGASFQSEQYEIRYRRRRKTG
jgi:hypothetical protein